MNCETTSYLRTMILIFDHNSRCHALSLMYTGTGEADRYDGTREL